MEACLSVTAFGLTLCGRLHGLECYSAGDSQAPELSPACERQGPCLNIFVGNLSFNTNEESVRELFSPYGDVDSVRIITDRETGRSRGFGFVEMADAGEAMTAMMQLNGTELDGRPLNINEARPRT